MARDRARHGLSVCRAGVRPLHLGRRTPWARDDVLDGSNTLAGFFGTLNVTAYLLGTLAVSWAASKVTLVGLMRIGLSISTAALGLAAFAPNGPDARPRTVRHGSRRCRDLDPGSGDLGPGVAAAPSRDGHRSRRFRHRDRTTVRRSDVGVARPAQRRRRPVAADVPDRVRHRRRRAARRVPAPAIAR